jgi:general secretion pathway protein M
MQLLPDERSAKTTALLLLVIVLLLVYLVGFHWFVIRHLDYAEEIGDLRAQLQRFQAVAAQRPVLQSKLAEIRNSQKDQSMFLKETEFDEAAAAMSGRIGEMVRTLGDDTCQIVSRQPVRPRVQERYRRVTVNVRMRCNAEDFTQVLYAMESGRPMMLVDNLIIIKSRVRRRSRGAPEPARPVLDIRFNVSGYLK